MVKLINLSSSKSMRKTYTDKHVISITEAHFIIFNHEWFTISIIKVLHTYSPVFTRIPPMLAFSAPRISSDTSYENTL